MGKKSGSGSGSGMSNPDHISESLGTIFWVKILKLIYVDPGSGMEKIRNRNGKNSDTGSGINIPDPQHCFYSFADPSFGAFLTPGPGSGIQNRFSYF
jgi:hypothetical protein